MSWWGERFPASKTPLPIEPEPIDYKAAALERVKALKLKLDSLDGEMLAFKSQHKIRTDRFGRLLSVESAGIAGFEPIAVEWRVLLKRRDSLVSQWHEALHTWSALQVERPHE